ncbi:MAG: DUF3623 domain-containing protein [Paracoccaceae bacterium]|nr:DUF3623 domain-containing protein [Paracoccaceae bacterium]
MASPWIAALVALFAWWFSTGAILVVVRHADRLGAAAHRLTVALGLPLLAAGLWGLFVTQHQTTVPAAYAGFAAALAVWGWIEMAFLSGVITGPNRRFCPPAAPEWERFLRAWGTIAYHEMLLIACAIAAGLAAVEAEHGFGLWTFIVLFFARVSAKLNLFFGVRKIHTEFLPRPLSHLPSHFRIRQMTWAFAVSVTLITLALGCWLERLAAARSPAEQVGFALLAAITALALLEHWLMVLPLPDERLWRWMLPKPADRRPPATPGAS